MTIGSVTAEDYTDWRTRFGNTAGSGAGESSVAGEGASVPEPTALLMFAIGAVAMLTTGMRIAVRRMTPQKLDELARTREQFTPSGGRAFGIDRIGRRKRRAASILRGG